MPFPRRLQASWPAHGRYAKFATREPQFFRSGLGHRGNRHRATDDSRLLGGSYLYGWIAGRRSMAGEYSPGCLRLQISRGCEGSGESSPDVDSERSLRPMSDGLETG